MAEWKRVRLGDVVSVNDEAYSSLDKWEFINYLDTGSVTENSITKIQRLEMGVDEIPSRARRKAYLGDIVYSTVRPNQRHYAILKAEIENLLVSTGFAVLRAIRSLVEPLFIYYYLSQDDVVAHLQLVAEQSVSTYPSLNPSDITNLVLSIPPLATQKKIAAVLGAIDDKIETNRKICANLEAQAQALFKSWFVDFEPFGGKMPKDWKKGKLGDLVSRMGTGLNPRDNFKLGFGNNYYVTIKNMGGNRVFLDEKCDKVDDEAIRRINERSDLRKGDVLFSGIGTIGRTYLIDETPKNWNTSESVFNMRPRAGIPSVYLYLMLLSDSVQEYVQLNALGSAQKGIRMADLKVCPAIEPTAKVLESFCKCVEPVINTVQNHWHESDALASMRDSLLPRLMSGEIDVEKVEVA